MQTLHYRWQRNRVVSTLKSKQYERELETAAGNRQLRESFRSISNYRLIFTSDENLSMIKYDTFSQDDICFCSLFHNVNGNKIDEESVGKIQDYLERTYKLYLTQNKVFEILKQPL